MKKRILFLMTALMLSGACWAAERVEQVGLKGDLLNLINKIDTVDKNSAFHKEASNIVEALVGSDSAEILGAFPVLLNIKNIAGKYHSLDSLRKALSDQNLEGDGSGEACGRDEGLSDDQWSNQLAIACFLEEELLKPVACQPSPVTSPAPRPSSLQRSSPSSQLFSHTPTTPPKVGSSARVQADGKELVPPSMRTPKPPTTFPRAGAGGGQPAAPSVDPSTIQIWQQKLRAIMHKMSYLPPRYRDYILPIIALFLLGHGGDKWADASSAITDFEERLVLIRSYIDKKHGIMSDEELQELVSDLSNGMRGVDRLQIRRYFSLQDELVAAKSRRNWGRGETALGTILGGIAGYKHYCNSQVPPVVAAA